MKSFIKRIEDNWPDIKVVARAASNQDANKAYQATLTMAQAHPNIGAMFMPEATSGMGAAQAAKELGGKIKVLCCDVNAKVLDMIKAGELYGALNPNQGVQGYFGMIMLYLAKHSDMIDPMMIINALVSIRCRFRLLIMAWQSLTKRMLMTFIGKPI